MVDFYSKCIHESPAIKRKEKKPAEKWVWLIHINEHKSDASKHTDDVFVLFLKSISEESLQEQYIQNLQNWITENYELISSYL